ncbi:MAG TPA: hypothetical protein VIH35_09625 [Kiritimatiellia bacterium]
MKKGLTKFAARFALTADEVKLVAAIAAIFIVGLAARAWHLRHQRPDAYEPGGLARLVEENVRDE